MARACAPAGAGWYTAAQAAAGKTLFDTHCAACHKSDLSGGAGPPLAGRQFLDYLRFSHITGAQILDFMSAQMPYDAPGSLTATQYDTAFAYILSVNHYPSGATPLGKDTVSCVHMLPYPKPG